jgi:hypothetical protein
MLTLSPGGEECHSKDAKIKAEHQVLRLKRKPEIPTSIPTILAGTRSMDALENDLGSP